MKKIFFTSIVVFLSACLLSACVFAKRFPQAQINIAPMSTHTVDISKIDLESLFILQGD